MDGGQPEWKKYLAQIFSDPDIKHGLSLFEDRHFARLKFVESKGRLYVECLVSSKKRAAKPEEVVRQLMLIYLAYDLKYPKERLGVEVRIKMGSTYASKKADILVFREDAKQTHYIIIETKKPKRTDGLEQLHSYLNATGAPFGGWTNGSQVIYEHRRDPNIFERIPRFPEINEDIDDVRQPIRKKDLDPIQNLKEEIQALENEVLAHAGVSAFEEVFKLIFAKLYDEIQKGDNDPVEFRTTAARPAQQLSRINTLFRSATNQWDDIFTTSDKIELSPQALVTVVSAFQKIKFYDADLDVMDAAFEYMINPEQKGDKGQFFTPRPVVKMAVKMLNPKFDEHILDPACGPGGFLIHSLYWVFDHYIKDRFKTNASLQRSRYANSGLFGIDFDMKLVRVAKAMMIIAGDGRCNIYKVNSLDSREWKDRDDALNEAIRDRKFDIVMTNPPFAGKVAQAEVLGSYDVAYKGDPTQYKRSSKMTRDVLFLERCLKFLKPGGRLAIVLPQGNLNNVTAEYVRNYVMRNARILAVIGLHVNTFKPFTGTKTSVLFLQKWNEREEPLEDYPIFFAVNEKPVKDTSGEYRYKKNADGSFAEEVYTDSHGFTHRKRIIEHDLDEIAEGFIQFAQRQRFDFWMT